MELKEYLDNFEDKLQQEILRLCTNYKFLDGTLLATDDIDDYWQVLAPEYIADAVEQIQDYPTVSVAWAAYLGMAVAFGWDIDWNTISKAKYKDYYGEQGFDDMDEHLIRDIIGIPLESEDAKNIEEIIQVLKEEEIGLDILKIAGSILSSNAKKIKDNQSVNGEEYCPKCKYTRKVK